MEMNMVIIFGELALVFIHKYLSEKKEHKKEKPYKINLFRNINDK